MNDGVTAVILNWKRPKNVVRILSALRQTELVHEAIVWNNNPDRSRNFPRPIRSTGAIGRTMSPIALGLLRACEALISRPKEAIDA